MKSQLVALLLMVLAACVLAQQVPDEAEDDTSGPRALAKRGVFGYGGGFGFNNYGAGPYFGHGVPYQAFGGYAHHGFPYGGAYGRGFGYGFGYGPYGYGGFH